MALNIDVTIGKIARSIKVRNYNKRIVSLHSTTDGVFRVKGLTSRTDLPVWLRITTVPTKQIPTSQNS